MLATDLISRVMDYSVMFTLSGFDTQARVCISNKLYDISHVDTSVNMDTNKQDIIIHIKED